MPELTFVLPHWLYWSGLIIFPLFVMFLTAKSKRQATDDAVGRTRLGVAYFILVTAGFVGIHRFYLRSYLGILFLIPFAIILYANSEARKARVDVSQYETQITTSEIEIKFFKGKVEDGQERFQKNLDEAIATLEHSKQSIDPARESQVFWFDFAYWMGLIIAIGLAIDAVLLPRLFKRYMESDGDQKYIDKIESSEHNNEQAKDVVYAPVYGLTGGLVSLVRFLNQRTGEFVAYWSVIAVVVYYYEVLARYVFNSPTNWAHEGMFLMFGMQYLISGAYAYLNNSHVRVDVFYANLSYRGKAMSDCLTSLFFFIFAGTMLVTGWIFFKDSFGVDEVSFTEWEVHYWPVKATIALGAVLLILQGIVKLIQDMTIVFTTPSEGSA